MDEARELRASLEDRVRGPHGVRAAARFSIGIDLGTTNTALAFVALDSPGAPEILAIPQFDSAESIVEAPALPSFLYLPEDRAVAGADDAVAGGWAIGRYSRAKAAEAPDRVVHSAKSWLGHHSADRSAPFLPWGSEDIARSEKISPVTASALILRYLRDVWNDRFAADGEDGSFDTQVVTITVPASFDEVAQRLTVAAAHEAGYPASVRLLEEPQAALYRWLEHAAADDPLAALAGGASAVRHVLVVDIGGGTSDFTLFELTAVNGGGDAHIKRIAVSEHLLLGGDNMDLALAHRLEPHFADEGESLSGRQWHYLVARCRDLKEAALAGSGPADEVFSVAMPGRGSRLIAQAASVELTRAEIERLLLDGFFPHCGAHEYPIRAKAALRELGLPYARDPAVTRHLADFVRGRPPVDAVLFNGGALRPKRLRERIVGELSIWQAGSAPIVLENAEPDLAVARGAARFGKLVHAQARRIEAGTAHAIFLQAQRTADDDSTGSSPALVCVLPHGAPTEQTFVIRDLALELRLNRLVRFQAYSSARHEAERPGDLVAWNEQDFQALPPLETTAATAHAAPNQTVPVRLSARLSELGRLELACASTNPDLRGSWPLEFNLRQPQSGDDAEPRFAQTADREHASGPNVCAAALAAGRERIMTLFGRPPSGRDKLTATRLLKSLEIILGVPKSQWNVILVRSLWSSLEQCMADRSRSVEHEEAWLIVAGFFLRPGFGAPMDDARIDRLWSVHEAGLAFAASPAKVQAYVLWRRVAGGLSAIRQERVLEPDHGALHGPNPPPELVLLAGSLERLSVERKSDLIERWIGVAAALEREKKHNKQYLSALGSILTRAPLYGGPEVVVRPHLVQSAFEALSRFEWAGPALGEWQTLFVRAARVVDNRSIDVPRSLRVRIADKLERAGVAPAKTAPLKGYLPIQRSERARSFGEALPPGLILRDA